MKIITQNHHVVDATQSWKYEMRRKAQVIQPFLYLGPSAATRDLDFMRAEGITMLLVIRNTMTAQASLLSGDKVASTLGIQAAAVDVAGNPELIAAFPRACKIINDHLIAVYRQSLINNSMNPESPIRSGKVLVFCESGNERSAAVAAAYLMTVYGLDTVSAIQYVQSQRFCVAYDDPLKHLLLTYENLLDAQRSVLEATPPTSLVFGEGAQAKPKRRREDTSEDDAAMCLDDQDDEERFANRSGFVPFRDTSTQ